MKKRFKVTVREGNACTHAVSSRSGVVCETFCGRQKVAQRPPAGDVDCRSCIKAMAAKARTKVS